VTTIEELARNVRLADTRLLELTRAGNLPGGSIDDRWRFHREDIDQGWTASRENLHNLRQCADSEVAAGCIESANIDEYEAAMQPWDMQLDQLSRGPFQTGIQYTKIPGMLLYEARWLQAARTRGASPEGFVMFGTSLAWPRAHNFWCGQALGPRRFGCAGPNSEFGHTSPDQSHHVVLLVERELLTASVGEETVDLICHNKHLETGVRAGQRMIAAMTGVVRATHQHPELLEDVRNVAGAQSWLLEALVGCAEHAEADESHEANLLRDACVHRAIELVDEASLPMTALQLAAAVGVSQRTLEHGFRGLLGVTPAVYLRVHRMNRANHELAHGDPSSTTVTHVALKWGFSHPGRFSAAYRALFGESPSQTLRQGKIRKLFRSRS
jgi:AraC-like DNA-binding protein